MYARTHVHTHTQSLTAGPTAVLLAVLGGGALGSVKRAAERGSWRAAADRGSAPTLNGSMKPPPDERGSTTLGLSSFFSPLFTVFTSTV